MVLEIVQFVSKIGPINGAKEGSFKKTKDHLNKKYYITLLLLLLQPRATLNPASLPVRRNKRGG